MDQSCFDGTLLSRGALDLATFFTGCAFVVEEEFRSGKFLEIMS